MKDKLKHIKNRIHGFVGDYRPSAMQLEVTNACNFRCIMCPFHGPEKASDRAVGFMDIDQYRKIVSEFVEIGGTYLIPQGAGESFLHPKFIEMLEIAKKEFGLAVGFNTNGSRLNSELAQKLIELEIDDLGFSIDANNSDTFQKITGGNLEQVAAAVDEVIEARNRSGLKKPVLRVLLVEQESNRNEIQAYIDRWITQVDEVIIQTRRTRAGRRLVSPRDEERKPCRHLFETLFIQWDGEMVVCCEDWESVTSVGNVFTTPLADLWSSTEMKSYRTAQKKHLWTPPEICRDCEAWAGGCEKTVSYGDRIETVSALTRVWRRK